MTTPTRLILPLSLCLAACVAPDAAVGSASDEAVLQVAQTVPTAVYSTDAGHCVQTATLGSMDQRALVAAVQAINTADPRSLPVAKPPVIPTCTSAGIACGGSIGSTGAGYHCRVDIGDNFTLFCKAEVSLTPGGTTTAYCKVWW